MDDYIVDTTSLDLSSVPVMPGLEELSAMMVDANAMLLSATMALTAMSLHPYEAAKMALFEPGYKFKTIDDIEVPEELTHEGIARSLESYSHEHQKNLIASLTNPDDYTIVAPHGHLSALSELSADKTFVVTVDKFKDYIEYLEIVQSIDVPSLSGEDHAREIVKRLGYALSSLLYKNTLNTETLQFFDRSTPF